MSSSTSQLPFHVNKPFTKLQNGTWLHDRPRDEVFQLLSDTFRMRREDKYSFEGFVQEGSVYAGADAASEIKNFRAFLQNAVNLDAQRPSGRKLLPAWWSSESLEECVTMGITNEDARIDYAVEKPDIQEFYKQNDMPMQLRMFGELLDGTKIAGQSGSQMMQLKASMER